VRSKEGYLCASVVTIPTLIVVKVEVLSQDQSHACHLEACILEESTHRQVGCM